MRIDRATAQAARALDRPCRPRSPRPGRRARSAQRSRSRSGPTPCAAARPRRGSSSCPRRSRRRARPAAARRSPAAPRRRRPRSRAARSANDAQVADRLATLFAAPLGLDLGAPIRSRIGSRPVRVGLRPTPSSVTSLPGTSRAATTKKAAEERSAGTTISPGSSRSAGWTVTRALAALDPGAGGGEHALAVVAGRQRLDDRGRAVGEQAGEEQAGLDLGAGDRQLVGDAVQGGARTASGGRRSSRALRSAPISRSGTAIRSTGRRRIESSPSSVHSPPSCPASQPGSSRSRVPALPTSIAAGRGPRRPTPSIRMLPGRSRPTTRHRARATAASVESVSAASR